MTDYGTFGFRYYTFSPKRQCVTCNRRVYVGVININDVGREREPGFRVMCRKCCDALDEAPGDFAEAVVDDELA